MALVGIQFSTLGALALTASPWPASLASGLLAGGGVLLGLWAIAAMRLSNVRVFPDVHPRAQLTTRGPYRWIRHPMYTAVVLVAAAWWFNEISWWRSLLYLGLVGGLVVKLQYEERLLCEHFEAYAAYMQTTKRLIPFVY